MNMNNAIDKAAKYGGMVPGHMSSYMKQLEEMLGGDVYKALGVGLALGMTYGNQGKDGCTCRKSGKDGYKSSNPSYGKKGYDASDKPYSEAAYGKAPKKPYRHAESGYDADDTAFRS
jgi:hypothetical protein